jgi:ADP-ribosylation factor-like protein 8
MRFWSSIVNWLRSLFFNQELELSVVGLQNAGKTTLVNVLASGEFEEDTIPTIGFNRRHIKKGRVELRLWDLGGQPKFRESWEKYCRDVDCIIFIVDSADHGNLEVASAQLHKLLSWPSLQSINLLVLGNKNDLDGALNEEELISALSLQSITGRQVACYSVSAKNQNNIDAVLRYLTNLPQKAKN